jgi:hypothetical protein
MIVAVPDICGVQPILYTNICEAVPMLRVMVKHFHNRMNFLCPCMVQIHRTKAEVQQDLPAKVRSIVRVALTPSLQPPIDECLQNLTALRHAEQCTFFSNKKHTTHAVSCQYTLKYGQNSYKGCVLHAGGAISEEAAKMERNQLVGELYRATGRAKVEHVVQHVTALVNQGTPPLLFIMVYTHVLLLKASYTSCIVSRILTFSTNTIIIQARRCWCLRTTRRYWTRCKAPSSSPLDPSPGSASTALSLTSAEKRW